MTIRLVCTCGLVSALAFSAGAEGVAAAVPHPRECAPAIGTSKVWNFGEAVPEGGTLRRAAKRIGEGLVSSDPANPSAQAGFRLNEPFTPTGAFVFEAEFEAGGLAVADGVARDGILWDDMAVVAKPKRTNCGFQLAFYVRGGVWMPTLFLGLSNETYEVRGPHVRLAKGQRAAISFYYGANRRIVWDFNGERCEASIPCAGSVAPSNVGAPVIGDRVCSAYHSLDGTVRCVRITPIEIQPFFVWVDGRSAFLRGESGAMLKLKAESFSPGPLSDVKVAMESPALVSREIGIGAVRRGTVVSFDCPLETRVAPGWRMVRMRISGKDGSGRIVSSVQTLKVGVGPRMGDAMPTVMWGYTRDAKTLSDYGFTHALRYDEVDYDLLDPKVDISPRIAALDDALVNGIGLHRLMKLCYPRDDGGLKYARRRSDGTVVFEGDGKTPIPEVSHPDVLKFYRCLAAKDAEFFGDHPGFAGILPCSERRDHAVPSFATEHLRYKAETGRDVPDGIVAKVWAAREEMERRYPDGVVPEDDPILSYYRWYWSGGDGWPDYSSVAADEYRKRISRKGFLTYWDPAVRAPARWGSGGSVDMINQWCYAVPEPMNVAGPCEELFAMAEGRPGQEVGIMTQLICYRFQMAPKETKVTPEPAWVRKCPDGNFPSIPPDTLQEAVWSMLAKPVKAVMFHGWGCIHETGELKSYVYTNPETEVMFKRLVSDLVAPLGPMLKRLDRARPKVAVLDSFTTVALGGPGSWGWKAPAITLLQRARLDPRVIYEQAIERDGLDDVRVLYLPQCRFLTPKVIDRIRAFQKKGGILLADAEMTRALKADIELPVVSFDPPPEADDTAEVNAMEAAREGDVRTRTGTLRAKAVMVAAAEELRKKLADEYRPRADSSSPEIVTYSRLWKGTPYVFAINDRRTFGDYVGQWGLTMEKGLPMKGTVTQADRSSVIGAVYELASGKRVDFSRRDGRIVLPVEYRTNDGRLFMFLREPIAAAKAEVADSVRPGESLHIKFSVFGESGRLVPALLPVDVRLSDSKGREIDGAGYACAVDGVCEMDILTNVDDPAGDYRLVCRDRASGIESVRTIKAVR